MTGLFRVRVARIEDITPTFRRFTFTGDDLDRYGDPGFDERLKVVFPSAAAPLSDVSMGEDWYEKWRQLPSDTRPPLRTYTTRTVRNSQREVDIDMVVHEPLGPASRWIRDARPGDEAALAGPDVDDEPPFYGIDFVPPATVGTPSSFNCLAMTKLPWPARAASKIRLTTSACAGLITNSPCSFLS